MSTDCARLIFPLALATSLLVACGAPEPGATRRDDDATEGAEAEGRGEEQKKTGDAPDAKKDEPGAATTAKPARRTGVVFLHGTGDQGDVADFACTGTGEDFHCEVKAAIEYWLQPTIDSERTSGDGARRPYAVLGCPLGSQAPWPNPTPVKGTGPEPGSAVCAAAETARFLDGPDGKTGTDDDITDIVLVTHSGGSNVVRYMLQQHASKPELGRIHKAARGFIGLAAPNHGTYLADWVFRNGSLADRLNDAIGFFGGEGLYDDDGTFFIRTTAMAEFNRDPAKLVDLAKDVAGVPSYMGSGTVPTARGDEAKVACAGARETKGLALLHSLYLDSDDPATFRDSCSDGFISCKSAMALANGDASRVIFGRLDDGRMIGKSTFRAHNQSRRQCDDLDLDVRAKINEILGGGAKPPSLVQDRIAFEPALVAVPAVTPASTTIRTTSAHLSDDAVIVEITVDVREEANLGVRATLVVGDASIVAADQSARKTSRGEAMFTLRLPRGLASESLSVRDVSLVRHDDATTLGLVERVDVR